MDEEAERQVFGDVGPWTWQVGWAWQQVAAHGLHMTTPPIAPTADDHFWRVAHWAPLGHLLTFGLGWANPAQGLAQWLRSPEPDPILSFAAGHWGADGPTSPLAGYAEHLRSSGYLVSQVGAHLAGARLFDDTRGSTPADLRFADDPAWREVWTDGYDPLHLADHLIMALNPERRPTPALTAGPVDVHGRRHHILVLDQYSGWYAALAELPINHAGPHDVRVDVHVRPIGWLGTYRRSTITGRWFRGRHAIHTLGA